MTKEEIIQAIVDDKTMLFIQPEQLAGIVDFVIKNYKPSLPSNLDEAAEDSSLKYSIKLEECGITASDSIHYRTGFKAGAEWLAGQGETHELTVESPVLGPSKICFLVHADNGDKVVVQIRKK